MKKNLTAVFAAILACLTLYAQAAPAEIETEYAGEAQIDALYTEESADAVLAGEYPNLFDSSKIADSWNASATLDDEGVITVSPTIASTYTTFKYPLTFKAGAKYELSYEVALVDCNDDGVHVEPVFNYVKPDTGVRADNALCWKNTSNSYPDKNGDWLKVTVTGDVPADYKADADGKVDALTFIAYEDKSYTFKLRNLTLRIADTDSNLNDWFSYDNEAAVTDDSLNPGNKCIELVGKNGVTREYPILRYKTDFVPGAVYRYSFKFAFTTLGKAGETDTVVPDGSNFTLYKYYTYYDSAESKNKSFSDVIKGSGALTQGENGWEWTEISGTFIFDPKPGYDYNHVDYMPWGVQIATRGYWNFKVDDFVFEQVSAPETLTETTGTYAPISYRDTTDDAGVRFLAAADNNKHRAADVEEYGWIVARKTHLDALGISAYGLTLTIDSSKYATGVSYNKKYGLDKHLAVNFDDDTTLFTGVVTGIPSTYNDDVVVARTYIKYSDGTTAYGTPVAASVASAKAGNFAEI